jgi:geranylgeranyl pyrophosphate synthase
VNLSPEQIEEVRTVIRDSGALAGTVDLIAELAALAKAELARAPLGPEVIAALGELADLVALREG